MVGTWWDSVVWDAAMYMCIVHVLCMYVHIHTCTPCFGIVRVWLGGGEEGRGGAWGKFEREVRGRKEVADKLYLWNTPISKSIENDNPIVLSILFLGLPF